MLKRKVDLKFSFRGLAFALLILSGACGLVKSESQKQTEEHALDIIRYYEKKISFHYSVKEHSCGIFDDAFKVARCVKLTSDSDLKKTDNAYFKISDKNRADLLRALENEGWISLQKPFSISSSVIGIKDVRVLDPKFNEASIDGSVMSIGTFFIERAQIKTWRRGGVGCAPRVVVSVKLNLTEAGSLYAAYGGELPSAFRVCFGPDNVGITPRVTPIWR